MSHPGKGIPCLGWEGRAECPQSLVVSVSVLGLSLDTVQHLGIALYIKCSFHQRLGFKILLLLISVFKRSNKNDAYSRLDMKN